MTKSDFYKELKDIGVDVTDKDQMKIWSLALLSMGQAYLDHKLDRCRGCHYENDALNDKREIDLNKCPNRFCPVKELPGTPGEVVDYLFDRDIPLDVKAFYHRYVAPILDELIKREEEREERMGGQNAR